MINNNNNNGQWPQVNKTVKSVQSRFIKTLQLYYIYTSRVIYNELIHVTYKSSKMNPQKGRPCFKTSTYTINNVRVINLRPCNTFNTTTIMISTIKPSMPLLQPNHSKSYTTIHNDKCHSWQQTIHEKPNSRVWQSNGRHVTIKHVITTSKRYQHCIAFLLLAEIV